MNLKPFRTARPALVALAIFAVLGPPARAALVVSAATQTVSADTSRSDPTVQVGHDTSGGFDATVSSQEAGVRNPALADASIEVGLLPDTFSGIGTARLNLHNDAQGLAESFFEVLFTLTSPTVFTGSAELVSGGNAASHAFFDLDRLGPAGLHIISESDTAPLSGFAGLLFAGDYRLRVSAASGSVDPNESGFASFAFTLHFDLDDRGDAVDPGQAVAEPPGWPLAVAGLAAIVAQRRQRPRQRTTRTLGH